MSLKVARSLSVDEKTMEYFMGKLTEYLALSVKNHYNMTSPELIRDIWLTLLEVFNVTDPLKDLKKRQNELALQIYPFAQAKVLQDLDPFMSALRFSISGNALDIMTGPIKKSQEKILAHLERIPVKSDHANELKKRIQGAKNILYIGDNCGEIVFDKLFIETIKEHYNPRITFMTRTLPVLNDATLHDALSIGMDNITTVIENGINEPLPGTILKNLSPNAYRLFVTSDLIIAKGGGNYDTLESEGLAKGKTTFLLQAKCRPYRIIHETPLKHLIVFNN